MSRAEREIARLNDELYQLAAARDQDRDAWRRALAEHPECPRCVALAAALDIARDTIDQLARERPG